MKMYSLRKSPQNYHPLDHTTMPSNSRTHSYLKKPRLTHSTPSNIKPARNLLKNTSRQEKSSPWNFPKLRDFSLSKRWKLGNYDPAKIISTSIAIQSRMPIPSPLSLILLTNYENCWSSPTLTYNRNTIMSSSNQKTNERLPSPPHLSYLNWTSCSSGCATHQLLTKHSWMISSEIIS